MRISTNVEELVKPIEDNKHSGCQNAVIIPRQFSEGELRLQECLVEQINDARRAENLCHCNFNDKGAAYYGAKANRLARTLAVAQNLQFNLFAA